MRKFLIGLVAMGFIAVACGSNNDTGAGATGSSGPTGATSSPTAAQTAADCAQSVTPHHAGHPDGRHRQPRVPAVLRGRHHEGLAVEAQRPEHRQGVRERRRLRGRQAGSGSAPTRSSGSSPRSPRPTRPAPSDWDFAIEQISYSAKRAEAVDFSDSYCDVNQALVADEGHADHAARRAIADLKELQARRADRDDRATRSSRRHPAEREAGCLSARSRDAVAAAERRTRSTGHGRRPPHRAVHGRPVRAGGQEQRRSSGSSRRRRAGRPTTSWIALQKGSPLDGCVNQALAELKADGTLQAITTKWLSEKTNVGNGPGLHAVAERTHVGGGRGAEGSPTSNPATHASTPTAVLVEDLGARQPKAAAASAIATISTLVVVSLIVFWSSCTRPNWPAFKQAFFDGEEFRRYPSPRSRGSFLRNIEYFLIAEVVHPGAGAAAGGDAEPPRAGVLPAPGRWPSSTSTCSGDSRRSWSIYLLGFGIPSLGLPGCRHSADVLGVVGAGAVLLGVRRRGLPGRDRVGASAARWPRPGRSGCQPVAGAAVRRASRRRSGG